MNSLLNGIRFFRPTICSHFHMIHMMPTTITPSKVLPGTYNQRLRTNNPTKTSWPELVGVEGTYNQCLRTNKPTDTIWSELIGLTAEEAKRKIKRPGAIVVPQGSHITFDYKPGRVRLFVDESNKVVRIKKG